jgi:DNA topoisomerase VI subunit A
MVEFNHKKQLSTQDNVASVVNDMQDSIGVIVSQLNTIPLNKGTLLTDIVLTTSDTLVAHNLGFVPRGFIVVMKTQSVDVYKSTSVNTFDERRYILLKTSSGTATVSIYIF